MLRLIVYDIADARRLHKVAEVCKDYGIRIEYLSLIHICMSSVAQRMTSSGRIVLSMTASTFGVACPETIMI